MKGAGATQVRKQESAKPTKQDKREKGFSTAEESKENQRRRELAEK